MKKLLFNKLSISLLLLITSFHKDAEACGPQLYSEDTRFSLFSPKTAENDALMPFHYTHLKTYPHKNDQLFMDREKNIDEWVAYGKNSYQASDVLHIQYNTSSDSFLNIASQKAWDTLKDNEWILWLTKKKNKQALQYMIYAKEVEGNMRQNTWEQWSDNIDQKEAQWKSLIEKGLTELKKVRKDDFLKERYAFQVIKSAYYNLYYNNDKTYNAEAMELYKKYLKNSNSIVAGWSLIYIAELEDDTLKRTQYIIEAFDKSNEKKLRAYSLMNINDIEQLVKTTSDPYYREIGTVILNINNSGRGMEQIKQVYRINPNNPYLRLMINREINKLEEWIWSQENLLFWPATLENNYYGSADYNDPNFKWEDYYQQYREKTLGFNNWAVNNRMDDIKYLIEFRNYLNDISKDEIIKRGYMSIAIAHLYNMNGEFADAEKVLKAIHPAQSDALVIQYHYEKNIVMLETYDFKSQKSRDLFTMSLIDINERNSPKLKYRYYKDYDHSDTAMKDLTKKQYNIDPQFFVYIGNKFIEKGFRAEGAMLIASSQVLRNEYSYNAIDDPYSYGHISVLEKYLYPEDIDVVLQYKKKTSLNLFERFIIPIEFGHQDMYLDLKGTLYLRQKDYANALKTYQQISPDFWETKYEFSQYLPIHSISELPQNIIPGIRTGNGKEYPYTSKLEILKEIIEFQSIIDSTKDQKIKAENQLYLANALYNISYYGSGWMTFAYGKSSYSNYRQPYNDLTWAYYSIPENEVNQLDNYYELKDAVKLYNDVLENPASNDDQKAIALTMLMQSETHTTFYNNAYIKLYSEDNALMKMISDLRGRYMKDLNHYKKTRVYQSLKTHCPDL